MSDAGFISPEAMEQLLAGRPTFLAFLERRLGSRELAEEVLQEALVRGIERGGAVRDGESAMAWFYRLLRNALVDRARRLDAADRSLRRLALEPAAHMDESLQASACTCVLRVVDGLKPEHAAALRAVVVEGKPVAHFAKEAGITANNAAVRLHRARATLGDRVRRCCGACADDGCADCTCA